MRVEILSSAYEPVPEPASWTMMIAGFGMVGTILRRRTAMA
ncbi:PEPxxWA-CTERM sorting domain-containing protein [Sandarakinorhabdus limnophila]|nr:PEPxxWA-CTERM sorting domain-containing protein [Sandarakinorhabdus limnophila]